MRDHSGCVKGFYQATKSWWFNLNPKGFCSKELTEIFMIGMYHPDGSTSGEFEITWEEVCNEVVPRLKSWNDGWSALANMPELITLLESLDDLSINPFEMAEKLKEIGLIDLTEYKKED